MPKIKDLILFYLFSFTWGLIWTSVGLVVFGIAWVFFHNQIEIRFIAGRISVTFAKKTFGGVSLGIVYFVDKNNDLHTHLHEIGHTVQNTFFGPLFILLVAIPSAIRYQYRKYILKKGYWEYKKLPDYDSAWFEGQATTFGYLRFYDLVYYKLKTR